MIFKINSKKEDLNRLYLTAMNGFIKLTPSEIDGLSYIMDNKLYNKIITSEDKKVMMNKLGCSKQSITVMLINLIDKKVLLRNNGKITVNERLLPIIKHNTTSITYEFRIVE